MWLDPQLVVEYIPRRTLRALSRQYFDYGAGKRRMLRLHPESLRWRQTAPPALVIGLAGSAVAAGLGARTVSLVVPTVYVTALVLGTLRQVLKTQDPAVLVFPAATATMHLSWGVGFLIGRGPKPQT